jgi:hypothetical protein
LFGSFGFLLNSPIAPQYAQGRISPKAGKSARTGTASSTESDAAPNCAQAALTRSGTCSTGASADLQLFYGHAKSARKVAQQLQLVLFRSLTCWVPCVQGRGGSWVPDPLQHRLQGVLGDVSGRVPLRAALSQRSGQGRGGCVQHLLCPFGAPLPPAAPDLFTDCSSAAPLWRAHAPAALVIAMRITIPLCKAPSANLCCVWLS